MSVQAELQSLGRVKEKLCYSALDFDTVLQEQIVSSAPQVVGSFSPLEEFDAPVYVPVTVIVPLYT